MADKRPTGKRNPTPDTLRRWDNEGGAPSGGRSRPKRPRDPAQLAKLMIDIASGEVEDRPTVENTRGRAGGLKGGAARAKSLDRQRRQEIARKAAASRWAKKQP
jgi:hypothetical protein